MNENRFNQLIERWLTPSALAALVVFTVYNIRALERLAVIQQGILHTQQQIIESVDRNLGLILEDRNEK